MLWDATGRKAPTAIMEGGSLDHVLVSGTLARRFAGCRVEDAAFLIEEDGRYGGVKPRRNYLGPRWLDGYSDHLPLVVRFSYGP